MTRKPHILCVSYDEALLSTRRIILESVGYAVTPAWGFQGAVHACRAAPQNHYDLFILGHSIPTDDKRAMVKEFRAHCNGPIIALKRVNEREIDEADYHCEPDPKPLLKLVAEILERNRRWSA